MDRARVIEVVETTLSRRGDGKERPIRIVTEYWSREGELLAERDPSRWDDEQHVIRLAVRGEREACANICDSLQTQIGFLELDAEVESRIKAIIKQGAEAIRARSKEGEK